MDNRVFELATAIAEMRQANETGVGEDLYERFHVLKQDFLAEFEDLCEQVKDDCFDMRDQEKSKSKPKHSWASGVLAAATIRRAKDRGLVFIREISGNLDEDECAEFYSWLVDNIKNPWRVKMPTRRKPYYRVVFTAESDAVLFKMRWAENVTQSIAVKYIGDLASWSGGNSENEPG